MFSKEREPTSLEREVERAIRDLKTHKIGSDEYVRTLEVVTKLHKMKEEEKPSVVSKDTLTIVAANLIGIIMILRHENVNVITSRAMNLILKPK
jgi:hypothetical protein